MHTDILSGSSQLSCVVSLKATKERCQPRKKWEQQQEEGYEAWRMGRMKEVSRAINARGMTGFFFADAFSSLPYMYLWLLADLSFRISASFVARIKKNEIRGEWGASRHMESDTQNERCLVMCPIRRGAVNCAWNNLCRCNWNWAAVLAQSLMIKWASSL